MPGALSQVTFWPRAQPVLLLPWTLTGRPTLPLGQNSSQPPSCQSGDRLPLEHTKNDHDLWKLLKIMKSDSRDQEPDNLTQGTQRGKREAPKGAWILHQARASFTLASPPGELAEWAERRGESPISPESPHPLSCCLTSPKSICLPPECRCRGPRGAPQWLDRTQRTLCERRDERGDLLI